MEKLGAGSIFDANLSSMKKTAILITVLLPFLAGCQKEAANLTVSPNEITLYAEGTKTITTNASNATFSSKDEYYAEVDETGIVTANKVGETSITVSGNGLTKEVPVTIIPKYDLYPDIDVLVGKSKSEVTKLLGSNYKSSTTSSGQEVWTYVSYNSYTAGLGFTFKSNGTVEYAMAAISTEYTSMLTKALIERYNIAGMQNDYYFFLNHGEKVVIALTVYSASALAVMYMENTESKAAGFGEDLFEAMKAEMPVIE